MATQFKHYLCLQSSVPWTSRIQLAIKLLLYIMILLHHQVYSSLFGYNKEEKLMITSCHIHDCFFTSRSLMRNNQLSGKVAFLVYGDLAKKRPVVKCLRIR